MSAFRAFVQYDQDVLFLTPRGVNSYKAALQNINISSEMLTDKIRDQFLDLAPTYSANSCAWFDPVNNRVSFAVPTGANEYADTIWHFDTGQTTWYKQTGLTVTSAFLDTDNILYHGDDTGVVYKHDPAVLSYAGSDINASAQTAYIDFFEPNMFKRIVGATIYIRGNGSYSLGVGCLLNYGATYGSMHSVAVDGPSFLWNGGEWTNDSSVYQWGSPSIIRKKFFPKGIFQNISSGANQPMDIFELDLDVEYLTQD
jgi:hypothetical protein